MFPKKSTVKNGTDFHFLQICLMSGFLGDSCVLTCLHIQSKRCHPECSHPWENENEKDKLGLRLIMKIVLTSWIAALGW